METAAARRSSALADRRFRWLVLALAGIPLLADHLFETIAVPVATGARFNDFEVYLAAARILRLGGDPYAQFFVSKLPDYAFNQAYIYPPLLAWLLVPLSYLPVPAADIVFLLFLQACLVAILLVTVRALGARDRQEVVLGALLLIGFFPVRRDLWNDQVNLVLVLSSAVLLLAYARGDRVYGGIAFGAGVAAKLLQAPLVLPLLWGRRVRILAAAAVTSAVLTAIAVPWFLPEYLFRVLPRLAAGTGFRENPSPAGVLERIFYPGTFYAGGTPGAWIRPVAAAIALLVIFATWRALGRPRADATGRCLEMAAAVAALPLLTTAFHQLAFLVLPQLVLLRIGLSRGDRRLLAAVAGSWLLLSPVHSAFLTAITNNFREDLVLRVWAETQILGILLLWLGCLAGLKALPSSHPEPLLPRLQSSR